MKHWLPNAIGFQMVWICAVAGAAKGLWWAGPLALAAFATWQLSTSVQPRVDAQLMLGSALVGFGIDTLWIQAGLMRFVAPLPWDTVAPVWIVAMWMGFALTLNHSLATLKRHLVWAAVLGIVGGPLAYAAAGRAWQAVQLSEPNWIPYAALALAWGLVTPALLFAARRLSAAPQRVALP